MGCGQLSSKKSNDKWRKNNPKKTTEMQRKADKKYYKNVDLKSL